MTVLRPKAPSVTSGREGDGAFGRAGRGQRGPQWAAVDRAPRRPHLIVTIISVEGIPQLRGTFPFKGGEAADIGIRSGVRLRRL